MSTKKMGGFSDVRAVGDSVTVAHIEKQLTSRHLERAMAPSPPTGNTSPPATGSSAQTQQPANPKK